MALKLLRDADGKIALDQTFPLTVEEVAKWEQRHVDAAVMAMRARILETCKDREEAIGLLEEAAGHLQAQDEKIAALEAEVAAHREVEPAPTVEAKSEDPVIVVEKA